MPNLCTALEGIQKSCENNSGGIYQVWFIPQDSIASVATDIVYPNYKVTAITFDPVTIPPLQFESYFIRRNTSNYTEEQAADLINGSTFVTQTINLVFHRREAAKSNALKILASGQQYLAGVVLDANGKYWYFPYLQLTATGEGSGVARADGSKYTVTLVAENESLALEVDLAVPGNYAVYGLV
jgi:hypothetical protein